MSGPAATWPTFAEMCAATGESAESLEWLANRGQYARHYRTAWVPKRHGRRLLEAPLPRLKAAQRVILRKVLDRAPLHARAMGFCKGRGAIDHASHHAGRRWVVTMDLQDFFATIHASRIAGLFRRLGYTHELARVLAELTTNAARLEGPCSRDERQLYERRHLPQGAPTSPALANLVATRLDRRLDSLAGTFGGSYSRYADDLVISCDRYLSWLVPTIGAIATLEGFRVNFRKTRVMGPGDRQMVTGLVVNQRPGASRRARKELEALLYNCLRHGPVSQDRQAYGERFRDHLRGRVAYVHQVDPHRSGRLMELFRQIDWADPA